MNSDIEDVIDQLFSFANNINAIVYIVGVFVGISAVVIAFSENNLSFLFLGAIVITIIILQGMLSKILMLSIAHHLQKINVIANILSQSNL